MASAMKDTVNTVLEKLHVPSSAVYGVPPEELNEEELRFLRLKYEKAGQGQVFTFFDELDTTEKASLFEQLSSLDPDYINEIAQKALNPRRAENEDASSLEPLPDSVTSSILNSNEEDLKTWYAKGLDLIAENKVAAVLMAGGQGTRLGSSVPKGCYDIGLPSRKSLFQLQAERIWKVQHLAQKKHGKEVIVRWYIMVSRPTRGPTEEFFMEHNYFGLKKENIVIFEQGMLPCISNDGKILLESKSKVYSKLP